MNNNLIRFFIVIAILKLLLHNIHFDKAFEFPILTIFSLLSILIALVIHEFAHALTADRLGDPNPRLDGRLSLNPLKHLDPIGTLLIIFAGFGWGKPVSFDPYNLAKPERDGALIALAGPISNFILWGICLLVLVFMGEQLSTVLVINHLPLIKVFLIQLMTTNFGIGIFNLMPIYPLDGHHVVRALLSDQLRRCYDAVNQSYGYIIALIIIFLPIGETTILHACLDPIYHFMYALIGYVL